MKFDWQAFEDGSLNLAEAERHRAEASSNPAAQAEVDGLRALRAATRDAVRRAVLAAPRRRPWPAALPWAVAGVAALAIAFSVVPRSDPMRFDTTPLVASRAGLTHEQTIAWLRKESGIDVPALDYGEGSFVGGAYGDGWACLDFEHGGKAYHLYVRKAAPQLRHGKLSKLSCGTEAYVGRGVGWECGGLAYYLASDEGGDEQQLAVNLAPQTLAEAAHRG